MDTMEQNKEMTASESLQLITETLNNSRKDILRSNAKYYMIWGALLTCFSLAIYLLWKSTGHAYWNLLWFAMPFVGFPLANWIGSKEDAVRSENVISRITGGIWLTFCIFSCSVAVFNILFSIVNKSPIGAIAVGTSLSGQIILLFGMAETITGVALKNWIIKVAGVVTGIGGLALYYGIGLYEEQMLLFTFAGVVLFITGILVKRQNR